METIFLDSKQMRLRRLRQRVRAFVDLCGDNGQTGAVGGKWAMLTATYAPGKTYHPHHITGLSKCLRQWAMRRGFKVPYIWVAELQQRGEVHYHMLAKLPKGMTIPKPDKQGWWKHGSTRIEWIRKSGKRYAAKYASKETQRHGLFAKGLRLCGSGGLPSDARAWFRWLLLPAYARVETQPCELPHRVRGGVETRGPNGTTFIPSPWECTPVPEFGGILLHRTSVDRWCDRARDPFPVETYLRRDKVRKVVADFCDAYKFHAAITFNNPWAN